MKLKYRIILSLHLAYAYLHLGGGSWWPYEKQPCLHWTDEPSSDMPSSNLFYFSPTFSRLRPPEESRGDAGSVSKAFNSAMPSLPAFGKLLLELFIGRLVSWESLDKDIVSATDEPFATEMLRAITACLATGNDKTLKDGEKTIKDDERLRAHFVKEVVLQIQWVLQVGYHLKVRDVFWTSEKVQIVELAQSPQPALKRLRSPNPMRREGPEPVPDGFCLHDGGDMEKLSNAA
jgi:hypothetical protein